MQEETARSAQWLSAQFPLWPQDNIGACGRKANPQNCKRSTRFKLCCDSVTLVSEVQRIGRPIIADNACLAAPPASTASFTANLRPWAVLGSGLG